jgi:Uri superfamily endonuclease
VPEQSFEVCAQGDAARSPGTYALFMELRRGRRIRIGRLGTLKFPGGLYVYVGSAMGSGGLAARVARHRRSDKKLHWHIDYFLEYARILAVRADSSGRRLECLWVRRMLRSPGTRVVAPHLGASDCRCPARLLFLGAQTGISHPGLHSNRSARGSLQTNADIMLSSTRHLRVA